MARELDSKSQEAVYSVVYLPCELKARDLDSRLLIAAHLVKDGYTVVIGQTWAIEDNIETAVKGCFLLATVNGIKREVILRCRDAGHIVMASDEESLPFVDDDRFLSNVDAEAMQHIDLFLPLRDAQRQTLKQRFPNLPMKTAGSVRVDLLRLAKRIRPIPEPYILFNTNFALLNSVWGNTGTVVAMLVRGGSVDLTTDAGKAKLQARLDSEAYSREQLMALIRWCADSLPILTIVRPHPVENAAAWDEVKGKNLRIVPHSAPGPWIANAKLMVHSNSTTGLEAAIVGTPCLNISSEKHENWAEQFVMRKINHTVASAQEAIPRILSLLETGAGLRQSVQGIQFLPDAGRRTADAIGFLLKERGATPFPGTFTWRQRSTRSTVERQKFTTPVNEFAERLEYVSHGLKMPPVQIQGLDDSVVMLSR